MKKILLALSMLACMLTSASALTIDDICGSYSSSYSYTSKGYGVSLFGPYPYETVTITKTDDTHVTINKLGGGYVNGVAGTFDGTARTITIDDTLLISGKYTIHAITSAGDGEAITEALKPCVAVINEDGTIQIEYDEITGEYWRYRYKETLTPKVGMTKVWEVEGTLDYLNDDSTKETPATKFRSIAATLTKWEGGDYEYTLTYGDPSYGYANPGTIQFNVDENLQLVLVNDYENVAPVAWYYYPFSDCNSLKLYTANYSGFDEENKEVYMWYYWYETSTSENNEHGGYLDFNWGETTSIKSVAASKAAACYKRITDRGIVIVQNGKTYDLLGKEIK